MSSFVLVHGSWHGAWCWEKLIPRLCDLGHEVTAIDLPAHGEDRSSPYLASLGSYSKRVQAAVEQCSQKPILVGHSLGAPIVCRYAADNPGRVGGLVLIAAAMDPGLEKIHPLQHVGRVPPIVWMLPRSLRNSNDELFPLEGELKALAPMLGKIRCPIVIIHGTDDSLVPIDNVDYMRRAFASNSSVRVIVLDGASHFLPWQHEAVIREAIMTLAQGLDEESDASQ